jgi:hypothetical protein
VWRDEIVAFPRPAAFARCLPISESIPGLGPAYWHREHRGGKIRVRARARAGGKHALGHLWGSPGRHNRPAMPPRCCCRNSANSAKSSPARTEPSLHGLTNGCSRTNVRSRRKGDMARLARAPLLTQLGTSGAVICFAAQRTGCCIRVRSSAQGGLDEPASGNEP